MFAPWAMAGTALALCTEIGTMATIPYKTDGLDTGARHGRLLAPVLFALLAGHGSFAAGAVRAVVGQRLKVSTLRLATKKGQSHLTIGPFGKLVAGTGFEPVTFGL